jgi:inner membrane protein
VTQRELTLAPDTVELSSVLNPQVRRRAIYEAVLYTARLSGKARFSLPPDLASSGIDVSELDLSRAELRFGLSDPRGLRGNPFVNVNGQRLQLHPGDSTSANPGFFGWVDASRLISGGVAIEFSYELRGNGSLGLVPEAGDTSWKVISNWASPSFGGEFLPNERQIGSAGFNASYRIGNLAVGRSLVSSLEPPNGNMPATGSLAAAAANPQALVSLVEPVDPYSQVNRATKYGFLFIGLTFLALLMFDIVGGVPVSSVEYLLMGAALVLFFVLLLAFAEVIGFTPAYLLASSAIVGLNSSYASAVLGSWRRAAVIALLLVALYAVLYVLLTLEAYSLLIGSLLLFVALSGVMYATRHIDWSGVHQEVRAGSIAG